MMLLGTQKFEGKTFVATVTLKTSRKSAMELFDMEIKHACAMQKNPHQKDNVLGCYFGISFVSS